MSSSGYEESVQKLEQAIDSRFGPAIGDPKLDAERNLMRICFGLTTPEEVGEPFYRAEDGSKGINVEGTVFEGLAKAILDSK